MREKKILVDMAASAIVITNSYNVIVITKEVEKLVFRDNHIFRYTCMYKQSRLIKQWN